MPASQGRSSVGAASSGGLPSGPQRAGAHEHGPRAGAGLAGEVDPVAHRHAAPFERLHQRGVAFGGCHHDDHLGVGAGGEGSERVGEIGMVVHDAGRGRRGRPGATSRPHRITMPGPCHSSSRRAMSRQAARELSVGSGGSRRSPMTSTLPAEGHRERRGRRRPRRPGRVPTPVSASASIRRPSCHLRGSRPLRQFGGIALPGGARDAVRLRLSCP